MKEETETKKKNIAYIQQQQQLFNFDDIDLDKDNFYVQRHQVLLYCCDSFETKKKYGRLIVCIS